ncbi:type IC specificity subunit [Lactobacillus helveticus]|uniref:Type IC specificity subunit n=2 Tax=Lactobacillus helveticus TaxID=1587 RepID=A0A386RF39_LACHE|nr:type IC specificity subunit [Lactobacillus helveticus]MCD9225194.1 restriction endonuclease subunit S [Lactobacillus helveticus]
MNKRIFKNQTTDKGDVPFFKISTFGKKADSFISNNLFEKYKEKYPYPQKGDLLISASGSIGRIVEYKGQKAYYQDSNIVWLNHNKELLNIYLKAYYQIIHWHGIEGSTIKRLYNKNILATSIFVPDKKEQYELGKLIKKAEKIISLQQRKLELLRTLKSGLSYKLFNKKHLNNLIQISLDQIGQTYSGLTGKSKKDFGHGHAFYVSYLNVNQNEIGNPKQIDRIEIDKKQNLVQKNDIFFTISSETPEEVGLTSLWPVSCENLYLNSFCFGFRISTDMFIPLYLGYLFRSEYFREKVFPLAQGISRYNLSKNNVLKIKIGQEEIAIQEKYARIMNDLDSGILRQKKKVKELKLCKKFLLQNMFI